MKHVNRLIMALVYIFLYAPLVVMVVFSFSGGNHTSVFQIVEDRPLYYWYEQLFRAGNPLLRCLWNSIKLGIISAFIATLLGTVAAVGIFGMKNRKLSSTVMMVNNIPMMNPEIVTGVSMMLLFMFVGVLVGNTGEKTNFWTLLIAHVTFSTPYVILNVLPKLRQTDAHLMEAALDLGCTPLKAFFKVVIPQIRSGILAGFLMAFTLSFDDFVISYYTTGSSFKTLPVYIYNMVRKPVTPEIYALYSIVLAGILVLLVVYNFVSAKDSDKGGKK
jgi:spermidine/putrescine transport system permease protein